MAASFMELLTLPQLMKLRDEVNEEIDKRALTLSQDHDGPDGKYIWRGFMKESTYTALLKAELFTWDDVYNTPPAKLMEYLKGDKEGKLDVIKALSTVGKDYKERWDEEWPF